MGVQWNGDDTESSALVNAINHQCAGKTVGGEHCEFGQMGVRLKTCAAHRMLLDDQKALDGLLFWRRHVSKLWAQEKRP